MSAAAHRYLLALGSNIRHSRHGAPPEVLKAAVAALASRGIAVEALSPIQVSEPVGPSRRRFANAVAVVASEHSPPQLLALAKQIEKAFGRRQGRRWAARVLDLDIVLWSGGRWRSRDLTIPHTQLSHRRFVLDPAVRVARRWRDPSTGLSIAHLAARLTRPKPAPTPRRRSGP